MTKSIRDYGLKKGAVKSRRPFSAHMPAYGPWRTCLAALHSRGAYSGQKVAAITAKYSAIIEQRTMAIQECSE
jgi:hypothetical protein